jgi:hypothetical protein
LIEPDGRALDALGTADKHTLAVLASIAGEQLPVAAPAGELLTLPPFAAAVAALSPSLGGLGIKPLRRLAETGVLLMASLTRSLPRLLERLERPGAGGAARTVAAEIRRVDTSQLEWAVAARAAHAAVVAAVGTALPAADRALLKQLMPSVELPGAAVVVPPLLTMVTVVQPGFQRQASHGLWQRDFRSLYASVSQYQSFLLRSGCAQGASAHLSPIELNPFAPSHTAAQDRMQPHIWRMALRYCLGMEPIPGTAAALVAAGGLCPSGCGQNLSGYDHEWVTNHLVSCAVGGHTQRVASAITGAVSRNMWDVGVPSKKELRGLSATSAHRPGDVVSALMPVPECFDAGGGHRWVVDTTVSYLSPSNVAAALHGAPDAEVARAEKDKDKQVLAEVAQGKRTALPAGFTFSPAGINPRGRMGPRLLKLMSWLAEHGATNGVNPLGGEEAEVTKARLMQRFLSRLSVALHRQLMEAYLARVQLFRGMWGEVAGIQAADAMDLRFQG